MSGTIARFLNLLFPVTCAGCGCDLSVDDRYRLCHACYERVRRIEGLICADCGIPLPDGGAHCWRCRTASHAYKAVRSYGVYEGLLRTLVLRFKFNNRRYLERILGRFAVETVRRHYADIRFDMVVPVPLHWLRRLKRGYNQAELLARQVSIEESIPLHPRLLRRRYTRPQFRLGRADRFENLRDKFKAASGIALKGKRILLVDDVCTTTATVEACAAALKSAGAREVYAATVARDC